MDSSPTSFTAAQDDRVIQHISKFNRTSSHPYTIITPSTSLPELEEFLGHNVFAIGTPSFQPCGGCRVSQGSSFRSSVTDHSRKFVLGVATQQDLDVSRYILLCGCSLNFMPQNFVSRRG